MSNEYEIKSLKDIYDKIPVDRVELCFDELKTVIKNAMITRDLIKELMIASGESVEDINTIMVYPEITIWTDDGESNLGFTLNDANSGDQLLSVMVKKEKEVE